MSLPDFPESCDERLERLVLVLDQLALAYDLSKDGLDEQEFPAPALDDDEALKNRFAGAFPRLGLYRVALALLPPEAGTEVTMGDALDDLTDIAREMQEVLGRAALSLDDATWHFRVGYRSHWGRHLRWLQLYLLELESVRPSPGLGPGRGTGAR